MTGKATARLEGAAWRTRSGQQLILRHCRGLSEFEACEQLQRQTWGYPDLEVTPRKSFMLAQELGGQVIGAFDEHGVMAGFAMAMAALQTGPADQTPATANPSPPEAYLHSHMLAVAPAYRNHGLGARLKLVQREDALDRGILRMTWTFDPLAAKNAYLNLHRLGAIARRYSPDFYGVSSSRLQGGLPTDRLHAEWWLQSPRVQDCVNAITGTQEASKSPTASRAAAMSENGAAYSARTTISLPIEIEDWKQHEWGLEKVKTIQSLNRSLFLDAFARGEAVVDFSRDAAGNGVYELAPWHPRKLHP